MNWDEIAKIRRTIDEHERLEKLAYPIVEKSVAEAFHHSTATSLLDTYKQLQASQLRSDHESLVRQLGGNAAAGATQNALDAEYKRLKSESHLAQLATGTNLRAIAEGMQTVAETRYATDLATLVGRDAATSIVASEESRMRGLINDILGLKHLSASSQITTLAHELADQLREKTDNRFMLPSISEAERMLDVMRGNYFGDVQNRFGNQLPGAHEAMLAMQAPWLDSLRATHSIRGFAELQAIGGALTIAPPFGDEFSESLRSDLGDWREQPPNFSSTISISAKARRALYVNQGLNTDLVDFPDDAFDESLRIARIKPARSLLVVGESQLTTRLIDKKEDEELTRTNEAHGWLQKLEFQLRKFIDRLLTEIAGPNWPKNRLPNGVYELWNSRKLKDAANSKDFPLVSYADFTEYADIICRNDNWKDAFESVFRRKESVRESFNRMHHIRLAIAHVRPISNSDSLYFYIETKRLLDAMNWQIDS